MSFNHGIRTRQVETSVSTPVTTGSGIVFVVGTSPIHTVNGKVNVPVLGNNYNECVSTLGYSDDWGKYSLCEVMHSSFKLYSTSPVVFVNVLDPEKHKTPVPAADYEISDRKVQLPLEAIKSTIVVKGGENNTTTFDLGIDYDLFYSNGNLVLEVMDGGGITTAISKLNIAYTGVDPSKVTEAEIIGGFDVNSKETTGFELLDSVFPKFTIIPDLILCPGWSHKAEIAAVMSAKAANINGIFEAKALIDVDTTAVKHYSEAPQWKKDNNINSKTEILLFPMVKLGNKIFHMSTHAAGLMGQVDSANGDTPSESPSNKNLQIDSTVLKDGTEALYDLQQVNYLNSNGIVSALNFIGGFVLWGNETACFPSSTDIKDYFISVSRMFGWVSNSIILTYWNKLDGKLNRRLIDNIIDSLNIWLNGLTSEERLLGGRVEFREEENSTTALMAGKSVFHIYLTPPSPAKEMEFVLEYDANYVSAALA